MPRKDDLDAQLRAATGIESIDKASSARVYDYLLGGTHNFSVDREFARQQEALLPDMRNGVRSNRAFIGRVVRRALGAGVTQFVDIGSGLPSEGQVHEVADREYPHLNARVVYVDNEPLAHAHAEILLGGGAADPRRHRAVFADYFDYRSLWDQVLTTGVINPDEPVCLLITAILHFMSPKTHPEEPLAYYRDVVPSGSLLALTHACDELNDYELHQVARNFSKTSHPAYLRNRDEVARFFADWRLLDPGLTWAVQWQPDGHEPQWWGDQPERCRYLAGVAVKP
ncbi:SAM-dependent methyltransferase [Amycolatopsis sp. 3B14]|uniref:SAM-dependent methyltransferase n=1 Tax=Amycolatopsis sp. 3B14 TaxID=3243600 RepID=UPI003D976019